MSYLSGAGALPGVLQATDYLRDEKLRNVLFQTAYLGYHHSDVFQHLTGPRGSSSPIHSYSQKEGMLVRRGNSARHGQSAVLGDNRVVGSEESIRLATNSFLMDIFRHSASYTEKQRMSLIAGGTLEGLYAHYEGRWAQVEKARQVMQRWRNSVTAKNLRVIGQGTVGALVSSNVIDRNQLVNLHTEGRRLSVTAVDLGKKTMTANGVQHGTRGAMLISPIGSLTQVRQDAVTLDIESAEVSAGTANPVAIHGGFLKVDSVLLNELPSLIDDSDAAQSWPFEPLAFLGTSGASATLNPVITPVLGGWTLFGTRMPDIGSLVSPYNFTNNTKVKYFGDFFGVPGIYGQELAQRQSTPDLFADVVGADRWFYICIYNHVATGNAGGEAGKMGFYRYRAQDIVFDGNSINIPANGTLAAVNTPLGAIAHGTGPFAGRIATEHPVGAYVFQVNRKGTALAFNVFTGPGSMCVAMNQDTSISVDKTADAGMVHAVTSKFVFGHDVERDLQGAPSKYIGVISSNPRPMGISDYPVVT